MPKLPQHAENRAHRPGNQAHLLGWRRRLLPYLLALLCGVVMAAIFAPLEWSLLSWFALVPILEIQRRWQRNPWLLGYVFGLGLFTACFIWLRTIFILAPLGLGLICACFPALWMGLTDGVLRYLQRTPQQALHPRAGNQLLPPTSYGPLQQVALVLVIAAIWVGTEWVRSWIFTGFPWNLLGVSHWQNGYLLPLTRLTGIYGISFIVAAVNVAFFLRLHNWLVHRETDSPDENVPWGLAVAAALLLVPALVHGLYRLPAAPSATLRIAAVQGNIPQIRVYKEGQLEMALEVYLSHTRDIIEREQPDLVVWPETAVPASLLNTPECYAAMKELLRETQTPMIVGSIYHRWPPGVKDQDAYRTYNSALLFNGEADLVDYYDKIQIVPFGEFVPFSDHFPWLVELIGMGRGLTRGTEHTVFPFLEGARFGMMICYEDVFAWVARATVLNGANVLMTITNDAWYWETAGSRQHMINSVCRSVETMRPMFRSGNNSDTCLIMPDGRVIDPLLDPVTGSPFARTAGVYDVPIYEDLPLTFYTRNGDLFAILCFVALLGSMGWGLYRFFYRRQRQHEAITPADLP